MIAVAEEMRPFALILLLVVATLGQASGVPYEVGGPTFVSEIVSHSYPGIYSSISKVDFRNFEVLFFDRGGRPVDSILLRKGRYKHNKPFDHFSMEVVSIYYLRASQSSTRRFALVLYAMSGGGASTNNYGIAEVFTISDSHLRSVQTIRWDTHFPTSQPRHQFDPGTNTLVIRSAHYIPGDAHCCVSAMDTVPFRWDGTRFVQSGIKTELSDYGRREGKILPR